MLFKVACHVLYTRFSGTIQEARQSTQCPRTLSGKSVRRHFPLKKVSADTFPCKKCPRTLPLKVSADTVSGFLDGALIVLHWLPSFRYFSLIVPLVHFTWWLVVVTELYKLATLTVSPNMQLLYCELFYHDMTLLLSDSSSLRLPEICIVFVILLIRYHCAHKSYFQFYWTKLMILSSELSSWWIEAYRPIESSLNLKLAHFKIYLFGRS